MTLLEFTLHLKIGGSLVGIAAPALLLPRRILTRITGIDAPDTALFRLYGMAVLALLFVYASGYEIIHGGRFPWVVVATGLISNGGAALMLALTGLKARWKQAGFAFVTLVTVLLAASAAIEMQS